MKWFKHDSNSNRDPKLEKVLMKYGSDGYSLYWMCLELIAETIDKDNINFELDHDAEILAFRLRIDSHRVEEIMTYMVKLNLFETNPSTKKITCLKLATRIENSIVKSPQLREIQKKLCSNPSKQPLGVGDNLGKSGISQDNIGKVGLEIELDREIDKDKDCFIKTINLDNNITLTNTLERKNNLLDHFNEIWKLYPNKKGKATIEKSIPKLKEVNKITIDQWKVLIDRYDKSVIDKNYIMHGSTFFNGGYIDFLDENYEEFKPKQVFQNYSPKKNYSENKWQGEQNFDF